MGNKQARAAPAKTNAARALDRLGIAYTLCSYDPGDSHKPAQEVAAAVGMDPASVFKTLVAHGDRLGHCMAVVPATAELDLKALANAAGDRKIALVPLKQVQQITGYVRGGVTALAAKRPLPVFLDESALSHARIAVSAGQRGLQLVLNPADYLLACQASLCRLGRQPEAPSAPLSTLRP